jgi:hypothetical protein
MSLSSNILFRKPRVPQLLNVWLICPLATNIPNYVPVNKGRKQANYDCVGAVIR